MSAFTGVALAGAAALGLSCSQAVVVVLSLKQKDLYKSYDDEWRSQNMARRVSRNAGFWLGGLYQIHLA
ncbi:MAG: hypothetical protein WCI39_10975 [Gallionellaceae bacterium]